MLRDRTRRLLTLAGAAYVAICLVVGFWPTPVDAPVDGAFGQVLGFLHAHGMPQIIDYSTVEFSANVALFIPVGALLAGLFTRRQWWTAALAGVSLSVAIELGQLVLLPARYASWGDILANSLGTVAGVAIAMWWRRRAPGPGLDTGAERPTRPADR